MVTSRIYCSGPRDLRAADRNDGIWLGRREGVSAPLDRAQCAGLPTLRGDLYHLGEVFFEEVHGRETAPQWPILYAEPRPDGEDEVRTALLGGRSQRRFCRTLPTEHRECDRAQPGGPSN